MGRIVEKTFEKIRKKYRRWEKAKTFEKIQKNTEDVKKDFKKTNKNI